MYKQSIENSNFIVEAVGPNASQILADVIKKPRVRGYFTSLVEAYTAYYAAVSVFIGMDTDEDEHLVILGEERDTNEPHRVWYPVLAECKGGGAIDREYMSHLLYYIQCRTKEAESSLEEVHPIGQPFYSFHTAYAVYHAAWIRYRVKCSMVGEDAYLPMTLRGNDNQSLMEHDRGLCMLGPQQPKEFFNLSEEDVVITLPLGFGRGRNPKVVAVEKEKKEQHHAAVRELWVKARGKPPEF